MKWLLWAVSASILAAQPAITDLQPRGAQKGKPFTLTLVGRNLGQDPKIRSSMPASFTLLTPDSPVAMTAEGRYATFLVEPSADLAVGVYPIRVVATDGISNVQLFTVGAFPEFAEDESRPGALPNSNDTMEAAQELPAAPFTLNGTLKGPERDLFRYTAKAGEKRVIEVEARRCGSAIDPLLEVQDSKGRVIARSEDAPLLGLDSRVEVTFPRDAEYYIVVRDARYSTQAANYYRLKVGTYAYAHEVFPTGGRRGEVVEVSLGTQKVTVDLRKAGPAVRQVFVNLPGSPALPVPFAVGEDPEVSVPAETSSVPVTINGRLSQPRQVDRYTVRVPPGAALTFRLQARELGTSKLMGVITVLDEKGKVLGRAGDDPLAEDVFNVNQSRTAGDPVLRVKVPEGTGKVTVSVEDLAMRGGPYYAYRLNVRPVAQDFRVFLNSPFLNVPTGGSAAVSVTVQRFGYEDEVQLRAVNVPKGLHVEGGSVEAGVPVKEGQDRSSRGVLIVTADPGLNLESFDLQLEGVAKLPDGATLVRRAEGPGMIVNVAGANDQGAVDRQRSLTAPWLGYELPLGQTRPRSAALEVTMLESKRMEEGDRMTFRWKWTARESAQTWPKAVNPEMVGAADIRIIDVQADPRDASIGTFVITTTKLTRPARYDLYVTGRLNPGAEQEDIVSRPIHVLVEQVGAKQVDADKVESGSRR